ncbi:MAG: helix-turn-helix domain-containing protein [Pseudomonadota bacterium]
MRSDWLPSESFSRSSGVFFRATHRDFDQQAALYKNIDMRYRQLTRGRFDGALFSAPLGRSAIHMEYCSQSIEKEYFLRSNSFSISLLMDELPSLVRGQSYTNEHILVLPPNGENFCVTPPGCTLLIITVAADVLLQSLALIPQVADWFRSVGTDGQCIQSLWLSNRLKADAFMALESARGAAASNRLRAVDENMIFSVANSFSMEWMKHQSITQYQISPAYERFRRERHRLINQVIAEQTASLNLPLLAGSKRSVEQAFATHVQLGPLAYSRLLRLHQARHHLRDRSRLNDSTGDIASDTGFWDRSRFSDYYRKQFGELPSETRQKYESSLR